MIVTSTITSNVNGNLINAMRGIKPNSGGHPGKGRKPGAKTVDIMKKYCSLDKTTPHDDDACFTREVLRLTWGGMYYDAVPGAHPLCSENDENW